MSGAGRWSRCIKHRGAAAEEFITRFLARSDRSLLVVSGGGFDPRSCVFCNQLAAAHQGRVMSLVIREERPQSTNELREIAARHTLVLTELFRESYVEVVEVFADDGAITGSRNAVNAIRKYPVIEFTDIIVDASALSIGTAFPLIRYLLDVVDAHAKERVINLHVVAVDEPWTDGIIESIASDRVGPILGFSGKWGLEETKSAAKLWLPQLGIGQSLHDILRRIHRFIDPHAVCPILPFSEANPRFADQLMQEFRSEIESQWNVDYRDLVYARENDPLDVYRTILRIESARRRVFAEVGGSLTILSPLGRKMLAIGILMAALDREFPVVHVESVGFQVDVNEMLKCRSENIGELVHLWLAGDPYPQEPSTKAINR